MKAITNHSKQGLELFDRIQTFLLLSAIAVGLLLAKVAPIVAAKLTAVVTAGVFLVMYFTMLGVSTRGVPFQFAVDTR